MEARNAKSIQETKELLLRVRREVEELMSLEMQKRVRRDNDFQNERTKMLAMVASYDQTLQRIDSKVTV